MNIELYIIQIMRSFHGVKRLAETALRTLRNMFDSMFLLPCLSLS